GVATSGGIILVLAPVALVCSVAAWLFVIRLTRVASLSSLVAVGVGLLTVGLLAATGLAAPYRVGWSVLVLGLVLVGLVMLRQSVAELSGAFDYVLLTVKGYDTGAALDEIHHLLRPGTLLGSFQNGVGNEEAIAAALPDQALLAGSLTLPVSLEEPGEVLQHSRRGGVALAPVSPEVNVAPLVRR